MPSPSGSKLFRKSLHTRGGSRELTREDVGVLFGRSPPSPDHHTMLAMHAHLQGYGSYGQFETADGSTVLTAAVGDSLQAGGSNKSDESAASARSARAEEGGERLFKVQL